MIRNAILTLSLCIPNAVALDCGDQPGRLILDNGYVHLEFDKTAGKLDTLKGDFLGKGKFGENLIAGIGMAPALTKPAVCRVRRNDATGTTVEIAGNETKWTIRLDADRRSFRLGITNQKELAFHCNQWFMVGFYKRGVAQCVRNDGKRFASTDPLEVFYTMDNQAGSVAIVPVASPVGTESVIAGDGLTQSWPTLSGTQDLIEYDIYPNQYAFPSHRANPSAFDDFDNLRAFYTAVYGSAAGCLGSFDRPGSAYPNPAIPNRAYGDNYTFFDPDSWSSVTTLAFSGDPYLENQARQILELAEQHMNSEGQIPHHFEAGKPTYIALSGASQTGPNIFWLQACVNYATATGNSAWLGAHYPNMRKATDWLLKSYDPERRLLRVNGPLWVDVFIHDGYTLDSNAFMLRVLPLMASVAITCGDKETAIRYSEHHRNIHTGLEGLWNGDDHYVTSRSTDWKTVEDKVDSDNFAAIAWGGTTDAQRIKVMYRRLDRWAHPGGKGTWVAECYYGPSECYLRNTGDSACAMARHWWIDMVARHVSGDHTTFLELYRNVRTDLLANTWLTERYNDKGVSYRCLGYHEYPEVLAMVMREQYYGIEVKVDAVTVNPIAPAPWSYSNGRLAVSYNQEKVSLKIPGAGQRTYRICGLRSGATYQLSSGPIVTADVRGTISFIAPTGAPLSVEAKP